MKWPWVRRLRWKKDADRLRKIAAELKSQRDLARKQRDRYKPNAKPSSPAPAINTKAYTKSIDTLTASLTENVARLETALVEREEFRVMHAEVIKDLAIAEARPLPLDLDYPLPSSDLLWRISGKRAAATYLQIGETIVQDLQRLCRSVGRDITSFQSVLDFGCGCGRMLRHLPELTPNARIYGADVDPEAVHWSKENLPFLADAYTLPELPPTQLESESFDFIFAISVFTHLPLDVEKAWLKELHRIAKPGALIILTFMPDTAAAEHFTPNMAIENENGFSFYKTMKIPELPDYYHGSYHTHKAMRSMVNKHFEILSTEKQAINRHQDVIVATRSS